MGLKPSSRSLELLFFPERDTEYFHFKHAKDRPFAHQADVFSPVNATWLADAALLAYWDEDPAKEIWSRAVLQSKVLSVEGAQCHIGWTNDFVIVAFRGTQPDDWQDLIDISTVDHEPWEFGGSVHEGFLSAHKRIWPVLKPKLDALSATRTVWFTGHSLGAVLATLSMDCFGKARGLYTIGSPPVGDRRFAREFDRRHAGRCFRYVNHHDIVVHLPRLLSLFVGDFTHVKELKYIDAKGGISGRSPSLIDRLALPWALLHARVTDVLIDHTPRNYATYIRDDLARHVNQANAVAGA